MKVTAIIQARLGSSRLPGKVLKSIAGEPMLGRVVQRASAATCIDEIIVATTLSNTDDPIEQLCRKKGWLSFRGNEQDVLDRYFQTAKNYSSKVIVRITSDCPLLDPGIVDMVVTRFLDLYPDVDYVSNTYPKYTFPRGLDVEIMSKEALVRAWEDDIDPRTREHVTPYIYQNPEFFRVNGIQNPRDYSWLRLTVDTLEDLTFVRKIFEELPKNHFSWTDVLELLKANPEWLDINRNIQQKKIQ